MSAQEALVCARCGPLEALIEQYESTQLQMGARIEELEDELAGRERQLRREGATVIALQRQVRQILENEPGSEDTKTILSLWMVVTGRASRKGNKADISISGKRGEVVKKAFKLQNVETGGKYTVGDLKLAVTALGLLPYVGPKGRTAMPEGAKRYDDVEHALRDAPTIDRFISYTRDLKADAGADDVFRTWQHLAAQEQLYAWLALNAAVKVEPDEVPEATVHALKRADRILELVAA